MEKKLNPFIAGLACPVYQLATTIAITNDFLMAIMFILATLGIIGAYVSDFPLLPGLYLNEVAHKTAISSLIGILFGLILFLLFVGVGSDADSSPMSPAGEFSITWAVLSAPGYPMMVFLMSKVNKRDLEAEQVIREEKKKNRRDSGGGPPIMDREGF